MEYKEISELQPGAAALDNALEEGWEIITVTNHQRGNLFDRWDYLVYHLKRLVKK